jgi:hypothetical protein
MIEDEIVHMALPFPNLTGGARIYQAAKMKVYVASSWRNFLQPAIVTMIRKMGHEVYDFRHPEPGGNGFRWTEIDPEWQSWTARKYREALKHPVAKHGYDLDMSALKQADVCVLVMPSGRSASFEAGYALGQGKRVLVVMFEDEGRSPIEPELMYRDCEIVTSPDELFDAFGFPR